MNAATRIAIVSVVAGIAQFVAPQALALDYKVINGNHCLPAGTSTADDFRQFPTGMVNVTQSDQFVLCGIQTDSEDPPAEGDTDPLPWSIDIRYFNSGSEEKWVSCVVYVGAPGTPTGTLTQTQRTRIRGNFSAALHFPRVKRPEGDVLQPVSVYCRVPPNTRLFRVFIHEWTATSS